MTFGRCQNHSHHSREMLTHFLGQKNQRQNGFTPFKYNHSAFSRAVDRLAQLFIEITVLILWTFWPFPFTIQSLSRHAALWSILHLTKRIGNTRWFSTGKSILITHPLSSLKPNYSFLAHRMKRRDDSITKLLGLLVFVKASFLDIGAFSQRIKTMASNSVFFFYVKRWLVLPTSL